MSTAIEQAPASPVELEAVAGFSFQELSCTIAPGQIVCVTAAVTEARAELWDVLTGRHAPRRGRLRVHGTDMYALAEAARLRLLARIGVVAPDGGLISNLRAWENLVLPVCYHRGLDTAQLEQPASAWLREYGLDARAMRELMKRLPERLHAAERILVATVRALLMEPDVMIYHAPFTGLEREAAARLLRMLLQYHRARPQRVAVLVLPDEPFTQRVPADVTLALEA
jgi:phospholipid/cholesterol/gamma-HCH transport system ATP-binding protein